MTAYFRSIVDLRPGELPLLARSALTLFGLIAAHTMLETARDALFLGKLPVSRLTFVYALLAGLSLVAARANARFVTRFGRRNGLIITLLASAFGTVVLYLAEPTRTVVFALYLWSGLIGSIVVVQFWMMVGHAYTVAQGKRLFGLLAAGGVLGAVVGAALAAAILDFVEVRELIGIAGGLFLLTAMFVTTEEIDEVAQQPVEESPRGSVSGLLGLGSEQPYLLRLALLVAISTAAVLATDYLFKATAAQTWPKEELGPFFARYYAVLNSIALIVQLLVSSQLIRRLGVIGAFFVLPVLLMLGGGASLLIGGTVTVLATKGADGALRHSLHRIASELLWMPLPESVRAAAKGVVDAVVVRGAQAATAGGLLLLATLGYDGPRQLSLLVVGLALAWLLAGFGLRRPYLNLFRSSLGQFRDASGPDFDLRAVEVVVESLSSREPQRAIAAIDLLQSSKRERLIPALILYHESEEVLVRALEALPSPGRTDWVPLAERLLEHPSDEVRVFALEALAREGHREAIHGRLLDISPSVRSHAAFWIADTESATDPAEHTAVTEILAMRGVTGRTARIGLLEAVERAGDSRWAELLITLAEDKESEVAQAAANAMTHVADSRFVPLLIRRLAVSDGRSTVRRALVTLGRPAFEALEEALFSSETSYRVKVHLPATIARFANKRAAELLTRALDVVEEGRVRYKVLRGLVLLVSRTGRRIDPRMLERRMLLDLAEHFRALAHHDLLARALTETGKGVVSGELLVGLLDDKARQALDRVFLLLQVSFPDEDLRSVRAAARSPSSKRRAQAQEFLDALTLSAKDPAIRELLRLAVDDLSASERVARAGLDVHVEDPPADVSESLQLLLQDCDEALAGLAAYHVLESGRDALRPDVERASERQRMTHALRGLLDGFEPLTGARLA